MRARPYSLFGRIRYQARDAARFRGGFGGVPATLTAFGGGALDGLSGTTATASVRMCDAEMDAHLESLNCFDAERQPTATFASSSVELALATASSGFGDVARALPVEIRAGLSAGA